MRIAQVVPSLEERHGGPSRSVRALANGLVGLGHDVELLTTADVPGPPPREHASVTIFPRAHPRRLCRSPELARYLSHRRFDCIHHHSLWLLTLRYATAGTRRSGAPLVISPRGMMSGWAWSRRRWRKRLAEWLVHPGAFHAAAGWHATSEEEAADIRRLGLGQPICVAPNGVSLPGDDALLEAQEHWRRALPALRNRPVALFYSRFHRKKRLRELLDLWLAAPRGDWVLLLAGIPEEYSVAEVRGWIAAAGAEDRVVAVDGTGRPPPYAAARLFLLPSHSENFGLVIAEALAAGVPALVTDTTPWQGLDREQAGWCVPWDGYAAALERALAAGDLRARGEAGREWMRRDYSWSRAAGLLHEFYRELADGRT